MSKSKLLLILAAMTLPLASFSVPTFAATAHNMETGAHTKNAYDTKRMARMKQRMMRRGY